MTNTDVSDELERAQNLLRRAANSKTVQAVLGQLWVDDVSMLLGHSQLQRAENNELDAKRYRWLRIENEDRMLQTAIFYAGEDVRLYGDELDHAIDSAMSNASEVLT